MIDPGPVTFDAEIYRPDVTGASSFVNVPFDVAYSHQKEYWLWVSGAKKAETRAARIEKMLGMLDSGERLK